MKKITKVITKKRLKYLLIADGLVYLIVMGLLLSFSEPAPVKALSVKKSTYDTASLSWEAAKGASGYRIYRSKDGKSYRYVGSTAETTYKDKGLRTGTTYSYRVAARDGFVTSDTKEQTPAEVTPELEVPTLKADTTKGSVELSFSEVDGATNYIIIRDGEEIDKVEDTSYVDAGAEPDKVHKYEVRAMRYKKDPVIGKFSNSEEVELHAIPDFEIRADESDIMIKWASSDYYSTYKLYNGDQLLQESDGTDFDIEDYKDTDIYDIKLIGYSEDGKLQSPPQTRRFKVSEEDMDNEGARRAACDWGLMIAADDSFAYGAGDTAHRCGCYFCGTNRAKKGPGYEKTYCCNPFVHACYAHGAGDPQMLSTCQNGGSVGMNSSDYTRYGNWINIGKPAYDDLEMGDVFIYEGHVMLYVGDDLIVHAAAEGWGPNTIRTDSARVWYDSDIRFVMRYTGTGSGTMYKIRDVDEKGNFIEDKDSKDEAEDAEAENENSENTENA